MKLIDLLTFAEAHRAANIKILNTSPYQDTAEAVQLLTAFKAKGQEYGAVFLLAVHDEAWGGRARGLGSRLSLPANLQFMRYAGATDDERLRLLYVAMTRAKSQLYLVNYTGTYAGKALPRLKYLNETVETDGQVTSPLLPPKHQMVLPVEEPATTPSTELAAYWQQRHETALTRDELTNLLRARLEQFQLSPTHLADFTDLEHCGPQTFFLKTILRFPQTPSVQVQFGNAMHETLEWLHRVNKREGSIPTQKATLAAFQKRLLAKNLTSEQAEQLLVRGRASLAAYLKQRAHTIQPNNECEYNFQNEGVFVGQAHVGGKIDKLIIDRTKKTIAIVDYKTGRAHSRWERSVQLHKYQQQLYFYKLLVEGSNRFAGYRVTDAYVEFVEPDEQGRIVELHVIFEPAAMTALSRLIQIVWRRIKQLDLPEADAFRPDIAGIEAFERSLLTEPTDEL